jgi:nucleotide-binding universal stress UspA family protein
MAELNNTDRTALVAFDGSAAAQSAATAAIQIVQGQNLSVRGLYVLDEVLALDTYGDIPKELGKSSVVTSRTELLNRLEAQGDWALEWLQAQCHSVQVPVTTEILFGGVAELVVQQANTAALLAIGRRGHSRGDDPRALGRHFKTIARRTNRPVLVGGDQVRTLHRLLLAYNGSKRAQNALTWVSRLRKTLPAEVSILVVRETDSDPVDQWSEEAQALLNHGNPAECWCLHRRGEPGTEIVSAAEDIQADLIVMGRYGHSAIVDWLVGSTVDSVLKNSQLSVLMV